MKAIVKKNMMVSMEYELCNEEGITLESNKGFAPLEFVQGSGSIMAALEQALEGAEINETRKITISPPLGFGWYHRKLVYQLPIEAYLDSGFVNIGDTIQLPDGRHAIIIARDENKLTADANHPFAGQTLHYNVTVKNVRAATPEEIVGVHPSIQTRQCSGLPGCC
jgi:FKBP-type peptidyl-prolyl cis-trans isomerase SlyD